MNNNTYVTIGGDFIQELAVLLGVVAPSRATMTPPAAPQQRVQSGQQDQDQQVPQNQTEQVGQFAGAAS